MVLRPKQRMKDTWAKLFLGDLTPNGVAMGFAFGTFFALLPTFGFSVFLALGLLVFFPNMNKPAVVLSLAFWNPIMQIPIYALSLELGTILYAGEPIVRYNFELLNQIFTFTRRFLVGHLVVTVSFTILSYLIALIATKLFLIRR
jgi:uncharacterized protein (DUF2062 family)